MKEADKDTGGMGYLGSLPRRVVTLYIPLGLFVFVLLFPFYWMVITSIKPDQELLSREGNPFWVIGPTLAFQRGVSGGALGEGAALATLMVPFLLAAVLFSYFGLQRRAWQQGGTDK